MWCRFRVVPAHSSRASADRSVGFGSGLVDRLLAWPVSQLAAVLDEHGG